MALDYVTAELYMEAHAFITHRCYTILVRNDAVRTQLSLFC